MALTRSESEAEFAREGRNLTTGDGCIYNLRRDREQIGRPVELNVNE